MKKFNLSDYNNSLGKVEQAVVKELDEQLKDTEITSSKYTDCEILEVSSMTEINGQKDVLVEVSCNVGIKSFCLRKALEIGLLVLPADKQAILDEVFDEYNKAKTEYDNLQASLAEENKLAYEAEMRSRKEKLVEAEKIKEQKEIESKLQKRIKKSQRTFESKIRTYVAVDSDPLDWLKNNVVSITAVIPSHLEKVFVQQFGDAPHKVVDSRRLTSGGYSMKFAESFKLTVKKDAGMHPQLEKLFKGNVMYNTNFIAQLVKRYGFEFTGVK